MEHLAESIEEQSLLRHPGAIMLVSCYELGHQPLGIAQPMGFLEQAGFAPASLDIAVENIDESALQLARFVGISVPMHTALRLGVRVAVCMGTEMPTNRASWSADSSMFSTAMSRLTGANPACSRNPIG